MNETMEFRKAFASAGYARSSALDAKGDEQLATVVRMATTNIISTLSDLSIGEISKRLKIYNDELPKERRVELQNEFKTIRKSIAGQLIAQP